MMLWVINFMQLFEGGGRCFTWSQFSWNLAMTSEEDGWCSVWVVLGGFAVNSQ